MTGQESEKGTKRQKKRRAVHRKQKELLGTFFDPAPQKKSIVVNADATHLNFAVQNEENGVSIKWMKKQSKVNPAERNATRVHLCMNKTFPMRREIITRGDGIAVIKDKFPLLFTDTEMIAEFKRITYIELVEKFEGGLDNYASKLIYLNVKSKEKGISSSKEQQLVADLRAEISKVSVSENKYAEKCLALLLLPHHLGESLGEIVKERVSPSTLTPYILLHRENGSILNPSMIGVYADAVLICKVDRLVYAFSLLLAMFYVFHIAYPQKCSLTLTFLQKYICDMQGEEGKTSNAIGQLIGKLAKCKSI